MRVIRLLFVIALAACGDSPAEPDWRDLLAEVQARRTAWEAVRPETYTVLQQHECACRPELLRPARITVKNEVVESGTWEEDGSPVTGAELAEIFRSMAAVFDLIENAANAGVPDLQVQFHPQLHYPTVVLIDYSRRGTEDDKLIQNAELTPAP